MKKIKTILWDIDGVLIWHHPSDPSKDWRKNIACKDMLLLWEEFQRSLYWERCLRDHRIDTRVCFQKFLSHKGRDESDDFHTVVDIWLKHNSKICKPALLKLKELQTQGYECALATNQDGARKSHITHWLEQYNLHTMPRFISCDLNHAKPDSEYFRHIENALGRNPEELLLLDDTHKNIIGAQKAGWSAIHIDERYKLKPSKWASLEFS